MGKQKNNENQVKQRYCKLCGSPIDPTTKKCTECGKQYFRPHVAKSIILGVLIFFLFAALYHSYREINQYQKQIAHLQQNILDLESELNSIEKEKNRLYEQYRAKFSEAYDLAQNYNDLRKTYAVCENDVVVVNSVDEWRMYHKCECPWAQINAGTKKIYLKQTAISMGYKPCDCINKPYKN